MTDVPSPAPAPRPASARRDPRFGPTILAAAATFLVLFEFLAFQLSSGRDPALGASVASDSKGVATRGVVHRRVIRTKVVHLPRPPSSQSGSPAASPTPTVNLAPAPAPAAATPSPSPAPAPAPAPPVTSSS